MNECMYRYLEEKSQEEDANHSVHHVGMKIALPAITQHSKTDSSLVHLQPYTVLIALRIVVQFTHVYMQTLSDEDHASFFVHITTVFLLFLHYCTVC